MVSSLSVYFGFTWAPSLWQGCLIFPSCPHAEHVSPLHRLTEGLEGKTWCSLLEADFGDQGHQSIATESLTKLTKVPGHLPEPAKKDL